VTRVVPSREAASRSLHLCGCGCLPTTAPKHADRRVRAREPGVGLLTEGDVETGRPCGRNAEYLLTPTSWHVRVPVCRPPRYGACRLAYRPADRGRRVHPQKTRRPPSSRRSPHLPSRSSPLPNRCSKPAPLSCVCNGASMPPRDQALRPWAGGAGARAVAARLARLARPTPAARSRALLGRPGCSTTSPTARGCGRDACGVGSSGRSCLSLAPGSGGWLLDVVRAVTTDELRQAIEAAERETGFGNLARWQTVSRSTAKERSRGWRRPLRETLADSPAGLL